jgi:hypothetical protein
LDEIHAKQPLDAILVTFTPVFAKANPAAIVGGRIIGVKGGASAKPFRQVWIGQKLAPESN